MTRTQRLDLLKAVLSINTAGANEAKVANLLEKQLRAASIPSKQVEYAPNRSNLVAEIGSEGPVLALSGHMDVVPAGDPQAWATEPFEPLEKGGKLYARGAADMKSGLVAMAIAMLELADEGANLGGRLRLLATVGEETGLLGAEELTRAGYANDIEALIIGEPTGHRIVYAHKGICTYTVTSQGKSAHSSMPQNGVNAIDNLILFYNHMMEDFSRLDDENNVLGKMTWCNSVIQGGEQFNIVPERASLTANLRTIPEVNNERAVGILSNIVSTLNETVPDMQLKLEITQSDPPMFSNVRSRLVRIALAEAKKMFGKTLPVLGAPGSTDAAKFIQGNPAMQVIVFGPGNDTMHQANEYVEIQNYLEMVDLYKNIVRAYFKGE